MKILFVLTLCIYLIGCAKKELKESTDTPSAPVVNFYKFVTAGDSAGVINSFASTLREQFLSDKDTTTVRHMLENWKGVHADVKVKDVKIDSTTPNLAKIYIRAVYTGKTLPVSDSIFFYVIKEDNEWKLSSLMPHRDEPRH